MSFSDKVAKVLSTCTTLCNNRNGAYGDPMSDQNLITTYTKASLAIIGDDRSIAAMRLLQVGSLIDMKDSRLAGGYKSDSVIDGINYRAFWEACVQEYARPVKN